MTWSFDLTLSALLGILAGTIRSGDLVVRPNRKAMANFDQCKTKMTSEKRPDGRGPVRGPISLGYFGVYSARLTEWEEFAGKLLGMQLGERTASALSFRMDSLAQRFFVENAERDRRYVAGWEAASAEHLGALAEAVEKSGIPVTKEAAARADDRRVNELVSFIDPMGNRVELFTGPHPAGAAFVPGRSISGFRTRSIGLGHVVYSVTDIEVAADFYRNVLGFNLSDYTIEPFKARFFHINSRHHSLALVQSPENGLHHLMIELNEFDDVGQGYDLALAKDEAIGVTLGRHSNDYVTSFYLRSPSGFLVEYGWGGREIDPGSWAPHELEFGPSLWGHDRSWLPEDLRKAANDLTKASAAAGNRAPVQVMEGNFVRSKMEG